MGNLQNFLNFINKEHNRPMRNPNLGPVPPPPEADEPEDPLAASKYSRLSTRQFERDARQKAKNQNASATEEHERKFPKSDETPI